MPHQLRKGSPVITLGWLRSGVGAFRPGACKHYGRVREPPRSLGFSLVRSAGTGRTHPCPAPLADGCLPPQGVASTTGRSPGAALGMGAMSETHDHHDEQETQDPEEDPRGGYLGYVAHEVRNPLSTALWSAELLARMAAEERGGPRGEKLTAMCLRSLGRVRQLVEDHFLCERLDVGGLPLRIEVIPVRALLEEVVG